MTIGPVSEREQVYDKVVRVSFDPNAPEDQRFTFENYLLSDRGMAAHEGDVTMAGPGNITFTREPPTASWKFVGAAVKFPGDQFKVRVPRSGVIVVIQDDCRENGTFPYVLFVQSNGGFFTSPDPVIVNADPSFTSGSQ